MRWWQHSEAEVVVGTSSTRAIHIPLFPSAPHTISHHVPLYPAMSRPSRRHIPPYAAISRHIPPYPADPCHQQRASGGANAAQPDL